MGLFSFPNTIYRWDYSFPHCTFFTVLSKNNWPYKHGFTSGENNCLKELSDLQKNTNRDMNKMGSSKRWEQKLEMKNTVSELKDSI